MLRILSDKILAIALIKNKFLYYFNNQKYRQKCQYKKVDANCFALEPPIDIYSDK